MFRNWSGGNSTHTINKLSWIFTIDLFLSFGGLLRRPFSFSGHKILWVIYRSNCTDRTFRQPDPLGYCASSSSAFKTSSHADSNPYTPSPILWFSLLSERLGPPTIVF
ncbi:hypothetical protein AVEN_24646-1 [Araneus ventricosus]|uniref:Uncharacterized protein n=1 Tax=Araneus ventricosus TaxID=182803 RepID=A0A4Y2TEL6_ARAVE|nr:hypothetical protein AVEN_24646-1 [Araneus ventricosus]